MSWGLLVGLVLALSVAQLLASARRAELAAMRRVVEERERSERVADPSAQLQHPVVDLSRCLGCGTCVRACPEEVLELVHGQAAVVHAGRCAGVAACERECPVGAITVTLANVAERRDVPAVAENLEAVGAEGVFLAGEVTAQARIQTAVDHGVRVAREVAGRVAGAPGDRADAHDLVVVGAGPAGLACALEAKRLGLSFVLLEQEPEVGGTVARYPRQKLVTTRPLELPLAGKLRRTSWRKEELVETWRRIAADEELPIATGEVFRGLEREGGLHVVRTESREWRARCVCLALGRRGVPRRLGVPGEELSKVTYGLGDAASYRDRRVLVVGGGDSAVEAAVGLAESGAREVTLSYRREAFFRIRPESQRRLEGALARGNLALLLSSRVDAVRPGEVELTVHDGDEPSVRLPNDDVFVLAGGVPPTALLEASGISFDPALRPPPREVVERGTGLVRGLRVALGLAAATLAFALLHRDYYGLDPVLRPGHADHELLRPGRGLGLAMGIAAAGLVLVNLLYLVRRSFPERLSFGSLSAWMTSHVATGVLAVLCVLLHAAMAPGDSAGGHAFLALVVLLLTGAVGRYVYAWVPRAANGRELELAEVVERLGGASRGAQGFRAEACREVEALVERRQWHGSVAGRLLALLGVQLDLGRVLRDLARRAREADVPEDELAEVLGLARRAHREALAIAHFEDLRAVISTWRYLHRWLAALAVLLILVHVGVSLVYGGFGAGGAA